MGRMEILKEIKNLIFSEQTEELKFVDAKSGDLILRVDGEEFAEGLPLLVVTEDGVAPAAPGEYLLDDGRTIVTDEAGLITEVRAAESEEVVEAPVEEELAEEVVEEEVKETMTEDVKEEIKEEVKEELADEVVEEVKDKVEEKLEEEKPEDEKVAELTARIEALEGQIEEMLALTKDVAQFSSAVQSKLDTFVDETPAVLEFKSIKDTYKPTVKENKSKREDKLEAIRNFRLKK